MVVIEVFLRIRESQPDVPPLHFLISSLGAMSYRYISEVMDGDRRLLRTLPGSVRENEYRKKAPFAVPGGLPRWEFQTVWLMGNHTGY